MKAFTPIKEYLANTKDQYSLNGSWDARIKGWVYRAVYHSGGGRIFVKEKQLSVKDCKAQLPDDYIAACQIQLKTKSGVCVTPKCDKTLSCCQNNSKSCCAPQFSVSQGIGELLLSSNADRFECVVLQYYGCLVDDDGNPLVPNQLIDAVDCYVNWKYLHKKREMNRNAGRNNMVPFGEVRDAKQEWDRSKIRARSRLVGPQSPQELAQLSNFIVYEIPTIPENLYSCCNTFYSK